MSHISDGLLHAHLDGALGPDEQRAWAEAATHLEECPECRRRLEEAREMRDAAAALLSSAAAPTAAARPAFEELVAQAEARTGGGDAAGAGLGPAAVRSGRGRQGPAPWWKAPAKLAWAASLVLAVGAGWIGRQLVVDEGGEVALLTTLAAPDADRVTAAEAEAATPPASRADPRLESDRVAEARRAEPGLAEQAEVGADAAPGAEADLRLQSLATKAAGARCYAAAQAREQAEAGADVGAPPAGDEARAPALRLGADGTATLRLEARPLVGFWEPAADSLHARVTDGTRWFDLRLAEMENGLRGSLQPAAETDGADRAAAADARPRGVELVDAVCPGS